MQDDALQLKAVKAKLASQPNLSRAEVTLITTLFRYGCRISELCDAEGWQLDEDANLLLRGKKGSRDRHLVIVDNFDSIAHRAQAPGLIFEFTNAKRIYNQMRRMGLQLTTEDGKNNKVTHAARYAYIERNSQKDSKTGRDTVGHERQGTTDRYIQIKKRIDKSGK